MRKYENIWNKIYSWNQALGSGSESFYLIPSVLSYYLIGAWPLKWNKWWFGIVSIRTIDRIGGSQFILISGERERRGGWRNGVGNVWGMRERDSSNYDWNWLTVWELRACCFEPRSMRPRALLILKFIPFVTPKRGMKLKGGFGQWAFNMHMVHGMNETS